MFLNELTKSYPLDPQAIDAAKTFYKKIPDLPVKNGKVDDDAIDYEADFELVRKMKALGWTESHTEGWYSTVFVKPSEPYVLKINKRVDRPYAWFALLASKFPNEHFPKIGNAKIIKVQTMNYRIYAIEKLSPFQDKLDAKYIAGFCKWSVKTQDDLQYQLNYGKQVEESVAGLRGQTAGLISACQILKKYGSGFHIDIHSNNIMLRGRTSVITDPFTPIEDALDS